MRVSLAAASFVLLLSQSDILAAQAVGPTNLDFEQSAPNALPPGWQLRGGDDFNATAAPDAAHSGSFGTTISASENADFESEAGILDQAIDAAPYRGRRIRISAFTRVSQDAEQGGRIWVRVDGPNGAMLYFDNMFDTPIHATNWTGVELYAPVVPNAAEIHFGYLMLGHGTAMVDDFRIDDAGALGAGDEAARPLSNRGLANLTAFAKLFGYVRYFHPSDEAESADWDSIARLGAEWVEDSASPSDLRDRLQSVFGPVAPTMRVALSPEGPPAYDLNTGDIIAWRRIGPPVASGVRNGAGYSATRETPPASLPAFVRLDLPRGLVAYVPLRARRDASGHTLPRGESSSLALRGEPTGWQPSGNDRATRLAAAIEAWNLAQHFFPYFHVVHTDWAAQLPIALREAANDRDADAFGATMQRMMAALHDGHAHADNGVSRIYVLPFDWEWTAENAMVVTDVDAGVQNVHRGDIVEAIGGRSIGALLRQGEPFVSAANEASRRYYTLLSEVAQASTQSVALTLRGADGVHHEYVTPVLRPPSQKPVIAELGHGIFYVDLTRLTDDQLTQNMQLLIDARGIVIDVRGYPTGAAISLLRHLVRDTVRSDLFQTPTYYLPNREGVTYQDNRWDVGALAPRIDSPVVFMTDANAISYGESIMGVVENEQLGPIVGAATAGTNGDIVTATLVGGMAIRFTGLVARRPDGLNRHGIGIRPTIPVQPTIAGIRAGRDEVLDVAVAAAERAASATTSRATR